MLAGLTALQQLAAPDCTCVFCSGLDGLFCEFQSLGTVHGPRPFCRLSSSSQPHMLSACGHLNVQAQHMGLGFLG